MIRTLLTTTVLLVCLQNLTAQNNTVTGTIRDNKKEPLFGATISVKGTTVGATTDLNGKFSLSVPKETKTVEVKYVGFDPQEIVINPNVAEQEISVTMSSAEVGLNQVVVSASKKKEKLLDAPASVSVISAEKITNTVATSNMDYFRTTPGVDVMSTGLVSGNVVVRGFNNIFSGAVLNVVDNRIGAVPSLRVNAYQLVPTSSLDIDRIEVLRGPASALYGPNASSGVIHIMTKSPLDQVKKFETTVSMGTGFTVQGNNTIGNDPSTISTHDKVVYSIVNPEFRHSGKLANGKFGYKISGSYFQGKDFENYDTREPNTGDSLIFGSVKNGQIFKPDSIGTYVYRDTVTGKMDTATKYDIRRFARDFNIQKWTTDVRLDFKPIEDLTIIVNGGIAQSKNIELTGLGAGQAKGWIYWYLQTRLKYKNFFFQYFVNASDAQGTYLIPQLSDAARSAYSSSNPYQVQKLIDKSKMHVFQVQHSINPLKNLGLVYGADLLYTIPNTQGTVDGRFEGANKLLQVGGYIQGDYEPLKWLKLVAALRVDYNSVLKDEASLSPRLAVVFRPKLGQNIRLTYNRAFDAPTTLNQFLDLSNGLIPNGINLRGIGNPYGYKYQYDANGTVQFNTAPYNSTSGEWITYGDKSKNYLYFDSALALISKGLYQKALASGAQSPLGGGPIKQSDVDLLINILLAGIKDSTGLIQKTNQTIIDYAAYATNKSVVRIQPTSFQDLSKINNQITQTVELGYKGFFFNKLSVQIDAYWTRINNYVSPLVSASGAVMLDVWSDTAIINKLKQNSALVQSLAPSVKGLLNNNPSYQNPNIVKSDTSSIYDEVLVILSQLPIGTVTPKDPKIGSDYILTYKNLGRLDVLGIDLGMQYQILSGGRHNLSAGGSFSWVDKDKIKLTSGEEVSLNAPKFKASLSADYMYNKVGIGYGVTWRWQGVYFAESAVYIGTVKAANLIDMRLLYRPNFYKNILFAINVTNVGNYHWQSFPGTPHLGTVFMMKAMVTF